MKSKSEIVLSHLVGRKVLDLGGSGYGGDNAYEKELAEAWRVTASRTVVDHSARSDIRRDLNQVPIEPLAGHWDVCTAFDVLEHLDHPVEVLRWIPTPHLIVSLPNALSFILRRMERSNKSDHLYSFIPYTARFLMQRGGWEVEKCYFTMGKWSLLVRLINAAGSIYPPMFGTGLFLHCKRPGVGQG